MIHLRLLSTIGNVEGEAIVNRRRRLLSAVGDVEGEGIVDRRRRERIGVMSTAPGKEEGGCCRV